MSDEQKSAGYEYAKKELAKNPLEDSTDYHFRSFQNQGASFIAQLMTFGIEDGSFNDGVQAALDEAKEKMDAQW